MMINKKVIDAIELERKNQIKQWGGANHDDSHKIQDFLDFIKKQIDKKENSLDLNNHYFDVYKKIAAISIAAMESIERKTSSKILINNVHLLIEKVKEYPNFRKMLCYTNFNNEKMNYVPNVHIQWYEETGAFYQNFNITLKLADFLIKKCSLKELPHSDSFETNVEIDLEKLNKEYEDAIKKGILLHNI